MKMNAMLKQAQKMQKRIMEVQEKIREQEETATAGGGMVTVTANGNMQVTKIAIDPQVVDPDDIEMLQDLILSATNEALARVQEMMNEEMAKVTGGVNIPGLM